MKLIDLDPRWWGDGSGRRLGVSFLCPHCREVRLGVAFTNPDDGGSPYPFNDIPLRLEHVHEPRTFDVPPGAHWQRSGEMFDIMTLSPSIDASKSGHWHGFVQNGEVK